LRNGLLTDEIEYEEFGSIGAACFNNDWKSMWRYNRKSEGQASCHTMQPPPDISSWRADRMKKDKELLLQNENKLSTKQLIAKYGLISIDYFPDKDKDNVTTDEKDSNVTTKPENNISNDVIVSTINNADITKIVQDDEHNENENVNENKENADSSLNNNTSNKLVVSDEINITHTLANVLIKLDNDCESLRTVDSNDGIPMSLSIPFGVDLTSKTFESLIDIAEKLAEEFYSVEPDANKDKDKKNTSIR